MAERRGLLDTSTLIDLERADPTTLPVEAAVATLSLGELEAGTRGVAAEVARPRALRLERLRERMLVIPFDEAAARAYADVYEATTTAGRRPRGRAVDLLIAATALANDLPLFTRNIDDVAHLAAILTVVDVRLR